MVEGDRSNKNVTPLRTMENFLQRRNLLCLSVCYEFKMFIKSDRPSLLGAVQ